MIIDGPLRGLIISGNWRRHFRYCLQKRENSFPHDWWATANLEESTSDHRWLKNHSYWMIVARHSKCIIFREIDDFRVWAMGLNPMARITSRRMTFGRVSEKLDIGLYPVAYLGKLGYKWTLWYCLYCIIVMPALTRLYHHHHHHHYHYFALCHQF